MTYTLDSPHALPLRRESSVVVLGAIDGDGAADSEMVVVGLNVEVVEIAADDATNESPLESERTLAVHAAALHSSAVAPIHPSDRTPSARITRPHRPFVRSLSHRTAGKGDRPARFLVKFSRTSVRGNFGSSEGYFRFWTLAHSSLRPTVRWNCMRWSGSWAK
jgi:hypothetical protein